MWPFRRKAGPPPPADKRDMVEDWQVGDLAVCMEGSWIYYHPANPNKGDTLRVSHVYEGLSLDGAAYLTCLKFEGKPVNVGWDNRSFRKLRPTIEPASDEFTADLRDRLKVPA